MTPSPRLTAFLIPAALAWAGAVGLLAAWLRLRRGVRTPYTRKIFHFCIFTSAAGVQLVWGLPGTIVFGSVVAGVVLYAVVRGDGHGLYEALARPSDRPHRSLFILVPLVTTAAGGLAASLLFPPWGFVGYMVAGWGDAVGEPVGTRWGHHRYRVPSLAGVAATRSLEGSAAVMLMGTVAAFLALLAAGVAPGTAAVVGVAAGAAATGVEAVSSHGLDNLTVQVAASGVAWLLLR